jgi:hypothetical protein
MHFVMLIYSLASKSLYIHWKWERRTRKKIVVHVTTNQFRNQSSKLSANGIFNIIYIYFGIFGTKPDAWNVMKLKPAT